MDKAIQSSKSVVHRLASKGGAVTSSFIYRAAISFTVLGRLGH